MKLDNQVAIVTGSSRGIGKEIAKRFAQEGARIVVNYANDGDAALKVVDEIKGMGREAVAFKADVSERTQAEELIAVAMKEFGRVDILINNAGMSIDGDILNTTERDWDRVLAVNLKGPFNCMQLAAKHMVQQKFGKIVNISSVSALGCSPGGELAYSCAKAGLLNITMVAAQDLGSYGINVNCIAPGFTATDFHFKNLGDRYEEVSESKKKVTDLGRVGDPKDIANAALFLASEESSFVTGQVLVVDGGRKDYLSRTW